jgi:hypothetical protein
MEWKLTSTNLCFCNNLTWIPKGNHSRMKKGGVREFFFSLWDFWLKWARVVEWKGYGGYLYPLSQKTSHWLKGTRILRVYVRILRTLGSGDSKLRAIYGRRTVTRILWANVRILLNTMSGHFGPPPGHSGFSKEFHKKAVYSGRFDSYSFCRFSWAQLPCQHL